MYKIDTLGEIPFHLREPARRNEPKYPFNKLLAGQSFFIPKTDPVHIPTLRTHMSKARRDPKYPERDFRLQHLIDGVRVWRIK